MFQAAKTTQVQVRGTRVTCGVVLGRGDFQAEPGIFSEACTQELLRAFQVGIEDASLHSGS